MEFDRLFKLIRDLGYTSGTHTEALARAVMTAYDTPQVELPADRQMRLYLAGPMTGIEDYNFPAFNAAAKLLRDVSFQVINPAEHGIVPGAEWADYMRYDIAKLVTCRTIALLPGWEKSRGACWEVEIAQRLGMQVLALEGAVYPTEAAAMAATVPAGWKLVPEMPTKEMLAAAGTACEGRMYPASMTHGPRAQNTDRYIAMLDAAPQAPVAGQPADEARMLRDLLARVHGDGGQYLDQHGLEKAVKDADEMVAKWRAGQPAEPSPADMLDWLDETNKRFKMGWEVGAAPAGNVSVRTIIMGGKSIREAIRAAMAAPKGDSNG